VALHHTKASMTSIALDHWHIELSSRCPLQCPRCPRAEVPESLLNKQLTLDFFKDTVGANVAKNIKKITLCGNDGDPIYATELIQIIEWFKACNPDIMFVIITNGSYRPLNWWTALGEVLNENDEMHWSIDGFDHASNKMYRINSDWAGIMDGIDAFTSVNNSTYKVWASIGFKFNQDNIQDLLNLAIEYKFDLFQLTKSTKWIKDDKLKPTDPNLLSSSKRYERELAYITNKVRPGADLKVIFKERAAALTSNSGLCSIGNKGVFLNSRGELYPCCWVANRYEHNDAWTSNALNLYNTPITELDSWYEELLFTSSECKNKCTQEKLGDINHITEW